MDPRTKKISKVALGIGGGIVIAAFALMIFSMMQNEKKKNMAQEEIKKQEKAETAIGYAAVMKNKDYQRPSISSADINSRPSFATKTQEKETEPYNIPARVEEEKPIKIKTVNVNEFEELKDPRYKQYSNLRSQAFIKALSASSYVMLKSSNVSANVASNRFPINGTYEEQFAYIANEQSRIDQEKQAVATELARLEKSNSFTSEDRAKIAQLSATTTTQNNADRWNLNSKVQTPKDHSVLTGSVIPGVMITGINSDLPGNIIGQVSQNVYDSATGRYLLIPQGSKIYGMYNSDIVYGQDRVLIAWQRLIFPNGKSIDLGEMGGSDISGYSGFNDKVNHHFFRIFGSSILLSAVTGSVIYISEKHDNDANNDDETTASEAFSQALANNLSEVSIEMIRKNMNIAPTIEIRNGYRFNIIVNKDLVLPPYTQF